MAIPVQNAHRRFNWLTLWAALSLLVIALLSVGFVATIGGMLTHSGTGGAFNRWFLTTGGGRVAFWSESWSNPRQPSPRGYFWNWEGKFWPPRAPDPRRCFWEFDAHYVTRTPTVTMHLLACPIWCAALPFTIAPLMWLRRRRQTAERQGFAVLTPS